MGRLAWLALILPLGATAAQPDVAGSRDPYDIARYPRAWIVEYQRDQSIVPRDFVMSRVDRIRRELRIEEQLRVDAARERVTYQIPENTSVGDVVSHFVDELGGDVLFRCAARGCGRSADWANQIFEEARLYGPDADQRYVALQWQGRLVALYVIERGNQRVYAHLEFLEPVGEVGIEPNALLARRLSERGWAVIEAATPDPDGKLGPQARQTLAALGEQLDSLAGRRLLLVCHLYGSDATARLVEASQACAQAAAAGIAGDPDSEAASRPNIEPYGAGPLLPRSAPPEARLELVLPGVSAAQPRGSAQSR